MKEYWSKDIYELQSTIDIRYHRFYVLKKGVK